MRLFRKKMSIDYLHQIIRITKELKKYVQIWDNPKIHKRMREYLKILTRFSEKEIEKLKES
ncbi:MAG: hypothetical protein U9R34_06700 [Nanoarchaeota archaeon]|nr:hypothetical protein [Nanoarchaeota archaeon]